MSSSSVVASGAYDTCVEFDENIIGTVADGGAPDIDRFANAKANAEDGAGCQAEYRGAVEGWRGERWTDDGFQDGVRG